MLPVARPNLEAVRPYKPGKPVEEVVRELGIRGPVVKLASNENPLGPSPKALAALRRALAESHFYPEDTCYYLKERLAEYHKVEADSVIVGNGSVDLIYMTCTAYLDPGDELIMTRGAFIIPKIGTGIMNGRLIEVPPLEYCHDLERMLESITPRTKVVYLDNPINPLGTMVKRDAVDEFMEKVPEHVLVVLDEAYADYITSRDYPKSMDYYNQNRNVLILRTFSKVHGLAGLRVGYGIAKPEIVQALMKVRLPFNVNRLSQIAASAALDDKRHVLRSRQLNEKSKQFLYREFKRLKLFYLESYANFVFVNFAIDSQEIFEGLLRRGVITRTVKEYQFPNALRITAGLPQENKRLVKALEEVLEEITGPRG